MKKLCDILFIFPILWMLSCETVELDNQKDYVGEWRYVGTFDHRANYACYICPEFDFDKSIYRITFNADNTLSTKINFMRGEGSFDLVRREPSSSERVYNIDIKDYRELNKPIETESDGIFRKSFLDSYVLSLEQNTEDFRFLQLQFNENEFLLFVQKN